LSASTNYPLGRGVNVELAVAVVLGHADVVLAVDLGAWVEPVADKEETRVAPPVRGGRVLAVVAEAAERHVI